MDHYPRTPEEWEQPDRVRPDHGRHLHHREKGVIFYEEVCT